MLTIHKPHRMSWASIQRIGWQAVFVLSTIVLSTSGAEAASFECARAKTEVDKAVCASPDLSKLDDSLAVAYRTALGGLSLSATAELKSDQRHWLAFAQRACTKNAKVALSAYDETGRDCLATVYQDRIRVLETSRMFGGYRFYPVGRLLLRRGEPEYLRCDNGPEFSSAPFKDWLGRVGITPIQIYPGSPWENGYNERFNGTLRREILNAEWFATTRQAQTVINQWLRQYNHVRPHHALRMRPPVPETILVNR